MNYVARTPVSVAVEANAACCRYLVLASIAPDIPLVEFQGAHVAFRTRGSDADRRKGEGRKMGEDRKGGEGRNADDTIGDQKILLVGGGQTDNACVGLLVAAWQVQVQQDPPFQDHSCLP